MDLSRRDFLASGTLAAGASLAGGSAAAAPLLVAQAGPAPRGFDPADELVPITATTTGVSAGDAGANNFGALKHWVIGQARTRLYAFVHISSIGLSGGLAPGEMLNIDYADVEACARTLAENPDVVLGVKVRITDNVVGQNGVEPLRRARRAAEMAGKGFRVMCHIGSAPGSLADVLDLLRPGDILTHS